MAGYDASSTNKSKRSINNYKDLDLNTAKNFIEEYNKDLHEVGV